eukprot:5649810-Prymnesium_polylepis.1
MSACCPQAGRARRSPTPGAKVDRASSVQTVASGDSEQWQLGTLGADALAILWGLRCFCPCFLPFRPSSFLQPTTLLAAHIAAPTSFIGARPVFATCRCGRA